jgi:WD40 repeat protein
MVEPPEGAFPFFMSDAAAEKYGMKSGPDIVDLIHRKAFVTKDVLQEIKTYGFMCAFDPCEAYLQHCQIDTFLVVCDTTSKYGEMFILLYKEVSIQTFMSTNEQKEQAELLKQKEEEMELMQQEQTKLDMHHIVYVDTPIVPNQVYHSTTSTVTDQEVESLTLNNHDDQHPFEIVVTRPFRSSSIHFDDVTLCFSIYRPKDDAVKANVDYVRCMRRDTCTQIPTTSSINSASQTTWYQKVNKTVQYTPLSLQDFGINLNDKFLNDICSFLRRVVPKLEGALIENETIDIYSDYCQLVAQSKDERNPTTLISNEDEQTMKEIKAFTDLDWTKGKLITYIDVDPMNKEIVAVSVCDPGSIDKKIMTSGHVKSSFIVVWKLDEQMHPHNILVAPYDCHVFKFNPKSPNIIVGGCVGGQVILWKVESDPSLEPSESEQVNSDEKIVPMAPTAISFPDTSHKRMVSDMVWLPPHIQINTKGHLLAHEHLSKLTHQFYSISGDGQVIFWDIRFEEIMQGKLPHIAKVKQTKNNHNQTEWKPLFKIKPKRLSGTGELSLCKTIFPIKEGEERKSVMMCASEEGELLKVDWIPNFDSEKSGNKQQQADFVSPEYVKWMKPDHNRPCTSFAQNPTFPEFILSVETRNFHIWDSSSDSKIPVFKSPFTSCHITGGLWSPTRPAVVYIYKSNGSVDIWDFTENNYSPSNTFSLITSKITCMTVLKQSTDLQYLALGDNIGSLHVFHLPQNLVKPYHNEHTIMRHFLDRCSKSNSLRSDIPNKRLGCQQNNHVVTQNSSYKALSAEEEARYLELEKNFLETS